jgi:hypothetical protein
VLFIGPRDCEIARLVEEAGLGQACDGADVAGIVTNIRRRAGDPDQHSRHAKQAAQFARDHDAATATGRWSAILEAAQAC